MILLRTIFIYLFLQFCRSESRSKTGGSDDFQVWLGNIIDKKLRDHNRKQAEEINQLKEEIAMFKGEIHQMEKDVAALKADIPAQRKTLTDLRHILHEHESPTKRQAAGGIGFTAYLDHDVTLGLHQTVVFNQVITNDGDGYNEHTGIFTCEEPGVYLFSFYIGERGTHQVGARLVVDGDYIVHATADTVSEAHDAQGSNSALVRLERGESVWIDVDYSNTHLEGSNGYRLTTFSGLYLYP